jgi:hypothetical protein
MKSLTKNIIGIASLALAVQFVIPVTAQAAEKPKPSNSVCSQDGTKDYACMEVNSMKVPSGDPVTFTGKIVSAKALKELASWTAGDNIVCLSRYKTTPEADGSWPWQSLEAACTTVRKNGGFTIVAEFGRKGTYYYGLEMGPCRSKNEGECGNADSMLVGLYGKGDKVIALKTS